MRRFNALDWFRLGAGALVASSAVLGALTLESALDTQARADLALTRLEVFDVAFQTATAITAERLPLETAFGRESHANIAPMADIRGSRMRTDMAVERFERRIAGTPDVGTLNFSFLRAKLKGDRARADELLARPLVRRPLGERMSVMRAMLSTSEAVEPMVADVGRAVIAADENLASQVSVARTLGALYESASRMSAEVVPVLQSGSVIPPEVRMSILKTQERVLALWELGTSQSVPGLRPPWLGSAMNEIQTRYFGSGFPFLSRSVQRFSMRAPAPGWSAETLSQVYRPTIGPIADLRDRFVSEMMRDARHEQAQAFRRTLVAGGLVGLILVIVPILVWAAYREVIGPLLQFRAQILRICEGVIGPRPAYLGSVPAVRNLYQALETLRDHERERQTLDRERADLARRLRVLSETDDLTGVLNRRGLHETLAGFGARPGDYAVALCDIDHFKAVNDGRGHDVGDEVLRAFGEILKRRGDEDVVIARHGGEEFAIVLRGGARETMLGLVEAVRAELEDTGVAVRSGPPVRVTASFGVCFGDGPIDDWRPLFRQADAALYAAKHAGRNRVRATDLLIGALGSPAPDAAPVSADTVQTARA